MSLVKPAFFHGTISSASPPRAAPEQLIPPEPVVPQIGPIEAGGLSEITNTAFISAIFQNLPEGAFPAVCSKPGDPTEWGWTAHNVDATSLPESNNNYLSCSSFFPAEDGTFSVRKSQFAAYHGILLDDLGTKIPWERLGGFELFTLIETSPGNFQGLILFKEPITDIELAERLLKAVMAKGLSDEGASGTTRWLRLPKAINGKAKHRGADGKPFQCRLTHYLPEKRYTPQEIIEGLKLDIEPKKEGAAPEKPHGHEGDGVFTPKASENPVVAALKARNLHKTELGSGKHDMTCPWASEHTDGLDTGAAYFEPDEMFPIGGYCCQHSHREKYHIKELLEFLDMPLDQARHKPVIRVVAGDLHRVVDVAEKELAKRGRHYQCGGLIVSVTTDQITGDPSIVPTNVPVLTRELSIAVTWEKSDGRSNNWLRCDPPSRHISILFDSKNFHYLPPLGGLARQPYFRESDGELVRNSGYDSKSCLFGVFDPRQYPIPEPTIEAARSALAMLEDLLTEFHFVSASDKAAALSAIFTAVVRPSLPCAPAYHVRAPVFGSGKTYLCELIGSFASPGGNAKVSYPTSPEEATKVILSLLLRGPAVIEFDDMDIDWLPHGTIKRMLTAEHITDRILGVSKTATVSTRCLFLGSGNNVGPIRDLLRRVLTIHVDPRCATPATMTYKGAPVDKVRQNRGKYVAAVLTIILAWRKSGSPKSEIESIVTFGGAWSEYCRQPLMWLGYPDPASSLLEQVKSDPDGDALGRLMIEWQRAFGSNPATVRKAVDATANILGGEELLDAMKEFPIEERGSINRSKLGWILKKNANRIVGGLEFQKSEADGRTAWRVVAATKGDSK